jgi:hypothetical protein
MLQNVKYRYAPFLGPLNHPRFDVSRRLGNITCGPPFQGQRLDGTSHRAQSTTHTASVVYHTNVCRDGERLELTALKAVTTAGTDCNIYGGAEIGMGDGGGDTELGNTSHYAAAARATVANVEGLVAVVGGG